MNNTAFVLGLFETGLGVARSLGRNGIKVIGFDFRNDIGFYSRYVNGQFCPNPIETPDRFIDFLISKAKEFEVKPVLFITSDDFLLTVAKNLEELRKYLHIQIPDYELLKKISDKYLQFELGSSANISVPKTILLKPGDNFNNINIEYPVFVKGAEATSWRKVFGGTVKGIRCNSEKELFKVVDGLLKKELNIIIQELIEGPDTNHYKFCGYMDKNNELRAGFCLKKIRQNPPRFGVGSVVESVEYPELMEIGKRFFYSIGYKGVGSAEFKLDEKDGKLKLIELNPRYWQQNALATTCGINFPVIQYKDLTTRVNENYFNYKTGIKWVNIYSDFDSFLTYRKEGVLNFISWIRTLKGPKVFSDWAKDDIKPGFYEIRFGKRLFNIPKYILKKI